MDLVSIIIPVYNAERFLDECLSSVIGQTYPDLEIILVNDGSTDGSYCICRDYETNDRRIKIIDKPNGGVSDARNKGLDASTGDYILFLDPDDALYPDAVSHLLSIAGDNHCQAVFGQIITNSVMHRQNESAVSVSVTDAETLCNDILYQKPGTDTSVCGKLYHRKLFDKLRFHNGRYEDLEIFYKPLFRANRIAISDKTVYFYRQHHDSFINRWSEDRKDITAVTGAILEEMERNRPSLLPAAIHRHFSANFNLFNAIVSNHVADRQQLEECFGEIKRYRREIIFDPQARIKNRVGAALSYSGAKVLAAAATLSVKRTDDKFTIFSPDWHYFNILCHTLRTKIDRSGFAPRLVTVIPRGGRYIYSSAFSDIPSAEVIIPRSKNHSLKTFVRPVLRLLPRFAADWLRVWDARKLVKRHSHIRPAQVAVPKEITKADNILVVDDAVDSGATLKATVEALQSVLPDACIKSAALTVTCDSPVMRPDFCIFNNRTLIRMPWSTDAKIK